MNNNINVFYLGFETPNLGGQALKTGKTAYQYKLQNTFVIIKGFSAELGGSYESPLDYGTLSLGSRYSVDMGLSKSLFNKKASLKLALSDVFNTNETNLTSAYPGLKYDLYQKNDTQIGRVSFSYRFGKTDFMPKKAKKPDEQNNRPDEENF